MRIVAITRVLDEADIIEAFIRHAAAFVDHHIVMDNGSKDGTLEILKSLSSEGISLTIYQTPAITFREDDQLTNLVRSAVRDHKADWVACLDADEFYDDSQTPSGLRDKLAEIECRHPNICSVRMNWFHYCYTRSDDQSENVVPLRVNQMLPEPNDYKIIVCKRLVELNGGVHHGSHGAKIPADSDGVEILDDTLRVCHYGERSPAQFVSKVVRGWTKVLTSGPTVVERGHAGHYRGPFEIFRDRPQDLMRNDWFLHRKNEHPNLVMSPMPYRGGPLRYTPQNDPEMQAVRALFGHLSDVCTRYGELIEAVPEARAYSEKIDTTVTRIS